MNESHENESPARTLDATSPKAAIDAALQATPKAVDSDDVRALCKHLRDRVGRHHPSGHKPPATPQWVKDMGTLLNSGPADQEGRKVDAAEVRTMIDLIFDDFAAPEARGFCWANPLRRL